MRRVVPKSYAQNHGHAVLVEFASDRPIRARNKLYYRILHWPIWIFAFFIVPGPITFELFARGASTRAMVWLGIVMAGTAIAGALGQLPGTEASPYIRVYGEDTPNPLYRRVCYTVGWGDFISFALLNMVAIADAVISGVWRTQQIYHWGYFPIIAVVWTLGVLGLLPRAMKSTKGEGVERRHFYSVVWAVAIAQPIMWFLWKALPAGRTSDVVKLVVFCGLLAGLGQLGRRGILPRTRPILPGTAGMSD